MAHARHLWLLLIIVAATLCSSGVDGAQRPKSGANAKSQAEVLDEEYGQYLRLLDRYRADDEGAVRDLRVFWTRLYQTDRETIAPAIGSRTIRSCS